LGKEKFLPARGLPGNRRSAGGKSGREKISTNIVDRLWKSLWIEPVIDKNLWVFKYLPLFKSK
jgi:hypothetical protein